MSEIVPINYKKNEENKYVINFLGIVKGVYFLSIKFDDNKILNKKISIN